MVVERLKEIPERAIERSIDVLEELVRDSQFLPKQFTSTNFYQIPWGKENFTTTPLGLAHVEFTKDIASRIEDYILLADKN